jgi:nucleotide-binding universal stress UspA family protein
MRIVAAVDSKEYSKSIIDTVARIASNTWADLTILGIQSRGDAPDSGLVNALNGYKEQIFACAGADGPYAPVSFGDLAQDGSGGWSTSSDGRKNFRVVIRAGTASKIILEETGRSDADLLVMGCTGGMDCEWDGEVNLPQKVARNAECSVLVIKNSTSTEQVVSFLDQTNVSQESLEMINQLVTVNNAGLKIVGLNNPKKGVVGKGDVEGKMVEILKYYNERDIGAWIKLIDSSQLEEYVAQSTREGMVALWMGKESFLSKVFSTGLLDKLITYSQSSVLILR